MRWTRVTTRMVVAVLVLVASTAAVATTLAPGFVSPVQLTGTSGGDDRATRFGVSPDGVCTGWIPGQPQHTLTLTEAQALQVQVTAPADTTLVMHGPAGSRCNDDRDGHNPGLNATFEAGTWQIFVGSYDRTARTAYTLTVTPQ